MRVVKKHKGILSLVTHVHNKHPNRLEEPLHLIPINIKWQITSGSKMVTWLRNGAHAGVQAL